MHFVESASSLLWNDYCMKLIYDTPCNKNQMPNLDFSVYNVDKTSKNYYEIKRIPSITEIILSK